MYIITGAAGFIGSCMVHELNRQGEHDLIIVDDFSVLAKAPNLEGAKFAMKLDRQALLAWLEQQGHLVEGIYHLGARTDTVSTDTAIFNELNLHYSQRLWQVCARHSIPVIYASSAATYGGGENGFDDDTHPVFLRPLNAYAHSKNDFDKWVLSQSTLLPFWMGLKFFNVYGPNEYHKGRMASVVWHSYNQIRSTGKVKLFRSHKPDCPDGGQKRDFIYVQDLLRFMTWAMHNRPLSGIYNLGTGQARTFNDLANAVFSALNLTPQIEYIDIPADIREAYQYFTEADMRRVRQLGYYEDFTSLEAGVSDYVEKLGKR